MNGWLNLFFLILLLALFWIASSKAGRSQRWRERQLWIGIARDLAHQTGTPLSALMGWVDLLPSAKDLSVALPEMQYDLERLRIILNRLSQIGAPTRFESVSVRQMTSHLHSYFQKRLPSGDSGVQITEEIEGDPWVRAQRDLLLWTLEHLIKNAADALVGGSGRIALRASQQSGQVEIQIQDSGRGIEKSVRRRIFDPGFTTKPTGRGLGLALAKLIIEEHHHGRVSLKQSTVGKGSTFSILLPAAPPGKL